MSHRPPLNDAGIAHLATLPPVIRLKSIRERLGVEREAVRTLPRGTFEAGIAARNVERLEELLKNKEREQQAFERDEAARQAEAERKQEASRQAAHDAETATLRTTYFASAPGASEEEFADALPRLREEHRARNAERDHAMLRERYRI